MRCASSRISQIVETAIGIGSLRDETSHQLLWLPPPVFHLA